MKNPKAFPYNFLVLTGGDDINTESIEEFSRMIRKKDAGMTLLDYFAGQALVNGAIFGHKPNHCEVASKCYDVAKAMLKEREKYEVSSS